MVVKELMVDIYKNYLSYFTKIFYSLMYSYKRFKFFDN